MSEPKKEKDIYEALEELEQASSQINSRKAREEARLKKHIKPIPEIKRIDVINQQSREQRELTVWRLKNKLVIFITVTAAAEWYMYHDLAKGNMVDFVLFNMGAIGLIGLVQIKKINGRK